jgi:hypothetical protein
VNKWRVTYEIVTPASAEHHDSDDRGFLNARGLRVEALIGRKTPYVDMNLRQALELIGCVEDSGFWFTEVDGRDDYRTGANECRSLHPPRDITAASYGRVARLLGVRR